MKTEYLYNPNDDSLNFRYPHCAIMAERQLWLPLETTIPVLKMLEGNQDRRYPDIDVYPPKTIEEINF